jgi:chitinase
MTSFQNDHVFEVQFISMFLEWLCQGKENTYGPYGKIGVPKGWQRPDTIWCKAVFGTNFDGFEFQDEPNVQGKANWIEATANQLGGQIRQNLMALYFNNGNAAKKNMVAGALPDLGKTYQLSMNKIRDVSFSFPLSARLRLLTRVQTVNVFYYLKDPTIKPKWTGASNGVELVSKLFDDNFWGKSDGESKYQNTGTPFERPSKPSNVQNWGLRTMWCYWIDLHLAKTEQSAAGWHTWAKNNLKADASTAKTEKAKKTIEKFVDTSMAHGAPLGPDQMKWPSGAKGSTQKASGYGMWGDNGFGNLGL